MPGTIGVDNPHQELDPVLCDIDPLPKCICQLWRLNNAIIILVEFLKSLEQQLLFVTGQQLRHNVCVDYSLELIVELS